MGIYRCLPIIQFYDLLTIINTGVTAALELALVSKDLTNMEKLDFVRRKVEFMQEFGDVGRSVIYLYNVRFCDINGNISL